MNKKEIKGMMQPQDIVCWYFQEYRENDDEVMEILWNHTSWPLCDLEIINNEVYAHYLNTKG